MSFEGYKRYFVFAKSEEDKLKIFKVAEKPLVEQLISPVEMAEEGFILRIGGARINATGRIEIEDENKGYFEIVIERIPFFESSRSINGLFINLGKVKVFGVSWLATNKTDAMKSTFEVLDLVKKYMELLHQVTPLITDPFSLKPENVIEMELEDPGRLDKLLAEAEAEAEYWLEEDNGDVVKIVEHIEPAWY